MRAAPFAPLRLAFVDLLALVWPQHCVLCDARGSAAREALCAPCLDAMPALVPPLCDRCGVPNPGRHRSCASCRAHRPAFRFARAVAPYEGAMLDAIHALKYGGRAALAVPLARLLAERDPFAAERHDVVVPVPLAAARLRERGFNQAALLARSYARRCGIRFGSRVLVRRGDVAPQATSGRRARHRNVAAAFVVRRPRLVAGRRVLLVDDVVTTGATADACARALRASGATAVDVLALARTGHGVVPAAVLAEHVIP